MTATTPLESPAQTSSSAPPVIEPIAGDRAQRFYDRIRSRVHDYVHSKGSVATKSANLLLLVPDVFMLLWRLATDSRVSGKNKALLGSGIAYYIFPLDFMPEAILGPIGFVDDLIFGVYILNKMLTDTDEAILREHWSGDEDVLHAIQRVLNHADNLVEGDLLAKLKSLLK